MTPCKNKCGNKTSDSDGICRECKFIKPIKTQQGIDIEWVKEELAKMKDSKQMESIFKKSIKEIEGVLDEEKPITDITKVATVTLSNYSKLRQTECHEEAISLSREKMKLTPLPEK